MYMRTYILYTYMFVNTVYLQCLLYSTNLHTYSVYTTYVIRTYILCAYYTIHTYVHARTHYYGYTYKHMYMYIHVYSRNTSRHAYFCGNACAPHTYKRMYISTHNIRTLVYVNVFDVFKCRNVWQIRIFIQCVAY